METFIWVEKYRPKSISECILPEELKDTFSEFVKNKHIPNLILSGTAGVGKTTVAKAMLDEIGATSMMINGSEESGIDVLRTKIKNFASTVSLEGGRKYIILDEADYLNPQSTQPALRGFMEEFHKNCGFILTCNYKARLIEPLHSRCSVIDFKIPNEQKPLLAKSFFGRMQTILKDESIEFDPRVVAELISKHFPDWRRVLNELQRYSASGKIDAGILVNFSDDNFNNLIELLRKKDFKNTRIWVHNNTDTDSSTIYERMYNRMEEYLDEKSIPHAIVTLHDYQWKKAQVADFDINMIACLTELMAQCNFK